MPLKGRCSYHQTFKGFLIIDSYVRDMAKGMIFFEDYFNYMDDMTPEQFYQFMGLIRDLRYRGIDTDVNEIEDKVVRLAWRSVRHSVSKSKKNAEDYDKRKGENKQKQEEPVISTQPETDQSFESKIEEAKNAYNKGNLGKTYDIINQLYKKYYTMYTFDDLEKMVKEDNI